MSDHRSGTRRRAGLAPGRFARDALLRNSFYLTLNSAAQAAVGFMFWLLNSRLFLPSQVGTATTLISGATVISLISLFGFNSTFVRFLPTSERRDDEINTGLLMVFATGLAAAAAYVVIVPLLVPRLELIQGSFAFAAGFTVLTAFMGVNLVTDSVFIAFRKAQYNVLVDGLIQGAVKLALPALLIGLGAYGMFMASGVAAMAAVVASIIFMVRSLGYKPRLRLSPSVLRRTWNYSAASYAANLLTLSPVLVIPLIVLNTRGPRQAAFYFIAYQVANLLFAVAWAVSWSFFAEGSYHGSNLPDLVRRAARIVGLVCIPCSLVVAAGAHWLLLLFGPAYSSGGTSALVVLALSAPSVGLCAIAMTVLRITGQLTALVATATIYAASIIGLALVGAQRGLMWVAIAFLVGNTIAGLLAAGLARSRAGSDSARNGAPPEPS